MSGISTRIIRLTSMVATASLTATLPSIAKAEDAKPSILLFTKAAGFVHKSIPAGTEAIQKLGEDNGFKVEVTSSPDAFTQANLAKYKAIVFLSTTGNTLPADSQRAALEGYIRHGGGFFGIHAASDMGPMATTWPFYLGLVGAAFKGHTAARLYSDLPVPMRPGITYGGPLTSAPTDADTVSPAMKASSSETARIIVEDGASPATSGWGHSVTRTDEWYGFLDNPRTRVHVIASVDEASYQPAAGAMNGDHPVIWCQSYQGGRSVYSALGHPVSAWSDRAFLRHILGGIRMAAGWAPFRCRVGQGRGSSGPLSGK